MMIHRITPSVDLNLWLKRLNTQHNHPTNQNKTLGTIVIKRPLNRKTYRQNSTSELKSIIATKEDSLSF